MYKIDQVVTKRFSPQVITWFQNRRAKLKRDMEELRKDVETSVLLPHVAAAGHMPGGGPPPHPHQMAAAMAAFASRNLGLSSAGTMPPGASPPIVSKPGLGKGTSIKQDAIKFGYFCHTLLVL